MADIWVWLHTWSPEELFLLGAATMAIIGFPFLRRGWKNRERNRP